MRMLKAQYDERGPVPQDVIRAVEFERPKLSTGQVLLEMLAAPINPSDVLTLTGEYGILPPLPAVGGNEGVGRVVELGPDTRGPAPGQVVLLPVSSGTWSTHIVANAAGLVPLPAGVDPKQLSMLTINPPTAALMLSEFVSLQPGDWVIQNAANSAVGTYLMQIAKHRGLRTVNIVRRESAVAGVRQAGGDVVLVDGEHLRSRVREATGEAQVRLAIDAVGGEATDRIAACLAKGGMLVNYGAMSGEPCHISPRSFIFNDVTLKGFWLAPWIRTAPREKVQAVLAELVGLVARGALQAPIAATYTVAEIKQAVAAAHRGERDGKVLVVSESLR